MKHISNILILFALLFIYQNYTICAASNKDEIPAEIYSELPPEIKSKILFYVLHNSHYRNLFEKTPQKIVLEEANGTLVCMLFNPDDSKIAATDFLGDDTHIWNASTGEILQTYESTGCICFNPNGKQFAMANNSPLEILHKRPTIPKENIGDAYIWDTSSNTLLHTLKRHNRRIIYIRFSPDGEIIATGSHDSTVCTWDSKTGNLLHQLKHGKRITDVRFSPNGKMIATASFDNTACLWNTANGKVLHTFRDHNAWVQNICFIGNGEKVISTGEDHIARIWSTKTGKEIIKMRHHLSWIRPEHISTDGEKLATIGDNTRIWSISTGRLLHSLGKRATTASFSPSGEKLATTNNNSTVHIWNAKTFALLHTLKDHCNDVSVARFSHDEKKLAVESSKGEHHACIYEFKNALEERIKRLNPEKIMVLCETKNPESFRIKAPKKTEEDPQIGDEKKNPTSITQLLQQG